MPYFKWKGVNLVGAWRYGRLFARTEQELELHLLQQNVALIRCRPTRMWFTSRIRTHACAQIFSELAVLCDAGVLLPHALDIVGMQMNNPRLQAVVLSIANAIQQGVAPHDAFAEYPHIFDAFQINMIRVGHRSGAMAHALSLLSKHLEATHEFSQSIKSALIAPVCTVVVFLFVVGLMFTHIIPSFASLFISVGQDIPELTKMMLACSEWMHSWHGLSVGVLCVIVGLLLYQWSRTSRGRYWKDICLMKLPLIGNIVQFQSLSYFFRALSLVLHGGGHVLPGIAIACDAISNRYIKEHIALCEFDVHSGKSLTQSLRGCSIGLPLLDVLHMIEVGEQSGRLAQMLERAALICEQRAASRLTIIRVLIQPMIMIGLGLLVALLIFAIYIPIFNLSEVLSVQ